MKIKRITYLVGIAAMLISSSLWAAEAGDKQAKLAKQLNNPIASLTLLPLQSN